MENLGNLWNDKTLNLKFLFNSGILNFKERIYESTEKKSRNLLEYQNNNQNYTNNKKKILQNSY